jgi:hypothetical protein
MWKRLPYANKEQLTQLRALRKAKLYADEDIEDEIVELIRSEGVNITSARELGHRGKPDSFQIGYAYNEKRFLLTKNEKDFFDNRAVPPHRNYGVIAIHGNVKEDDYWTAIDILLDHIIECGEMYIGTKVRIKGNEVTFYFLENGQRKVIRRKFEDDGEIYLWEEDKAS